MEIHVMGIDLGKTFHLVGVDSCGNVVVRKRVRARSCWRTRRTYESSGSVWMRFVPIKTEEHWICRPCYRVRERWVMRRTAVVNQIRSLLLERGADPKDGRK
jgi:hypothetical protein